MYFTGSSVVGLLICFVVLFCYDCETCCATKFLSQQPVKVLIYFPANFVKTLRIQRTPTNLFETVDRSGVRTRVLPEHCPTLSSKPPSRFIQPIRSTDHSGDQLLRAVVALSHVVQHLHCFLGMNCANDRHAHPDFLTRATTPLRHHE